MLGKFEAVVNSINYNDTCRPSDLAQLCSEKTHCEFPCILSEQPTIAPEGAGGFQHATWYPVETNAWLCTSKKHADLPGPWPQIATVSPLPTRPSSVPCQAVHRMSDMNSTFSSGNSSPIFRHKLSAARQTCNVCRGGLQVAALLEGIKICIA